MRIIFSPIRSDLAPPVLTVSRGALLNNGQPIAAPYLVEARGDTVTVLLPIGARPTQAQRFPEPVEVTSGEVPLPAAPVFDTPATILTRAQWEWMLVRFRLHDVIAAVMLAIDRAADTDAERAAFADLYRAVHFSQSYRLREVQRLVAAYSQIIQATIGRAVSDEELAAAFAEAAKTPA